MGFYSNGFHAFVFFFKWAQTMSTRNKITFVIDLPSGTEDTYAVNPIDDGNALQLTVSYPQPMTDVVELRHFWVKPDVEPRMSLDHPKIGACVNALRLAR